jgi:hypothetical protein
MITKEQAITAGEGFRMEFHFNGCTRTIGPRGGVKTKVEIWRANGKCQTWKTRPDEFSLPIKHGFNGPYSYITEKNASGWHLASECPLDAQVVEQSA